jgi:uncharacterized spore protein YtfJ
MEQVKTLFDLIRSKLPGAAAKDAVVSKPISAGDRHVLVLSEVTFSLFGSGGTGETDVADKARPSPSKGSGIGGGGGAKACPVAVLVVENGAVRLESLV